MIKAANMQPMTSSVLSSPSSAISSQATTPAPDLSKELSTNTINVAAEPASPAGADMSSNNPLSPQTQNVLSPPVVAAPAVTAQSSEVSAKLMKLQEVNDRLTETVREQQVDTQMRLLSLEQKLASVSSGIDELDQTIQALSDQVQQSKNLQSALLAAQKSQKISKNKQMQQMKQYFVQAVIPGRAWLRGADGSVLTVTVGDMVPGYGQVSTIDAYNGMVTMSSGIQIRYGLNS